MTREVELATVTVQQCQLRLRRGQEQVRQAREILRRAVRAAADAELQLGDATQRLTRIEMDPAVGAGFGGRAR